MTIGKFGVERHRAETAIRQIDNAVQRAEEAGHQKRNAQRLMIETLLSLTETRDTETGKHSRRTSQYARCSRWSSPDIRRSTSKLTSERIDLPWRAWRRCTTSERSGVPDAVLNKPGALTPDEFAEMKRHPIHGRDVILRAEKARRYHRRRHPGDGQGDRLHAPREMGRHRLSERVERAATSLCPDG